MVEALKTDERQFQRGLSIASQQHLLRIVRRCYDDSVWDRLCQIPEFERRVQVANGIDEVEEIVAYADSLLRPPLPPDS